MGNFQGITFLQIRAEREIFKFALSVPLMVQRILQPFDF